MNVAGEEGKAGVAPEQLDAFIARSPVPVAGLMTMPPLPRDPENSRRWFAALRELADERGLEHLSMGTSQDYRGRGRRGRDDRADRHETVPLSGRRSATANG